jgi:hypothetical protein
MPDKIRLLEVFEGKGSLKIVLGVSVLFFLVVELMIFVAVESSSGERSMVEVRNKHGQLVYKTQGSTLGHINQPHFERHYGALENYDIEVKTEEHPFSVRDWISAAVGIPVALILLISFLVKVFLALVYGEEKPDMGIGSSGDGKKQVFLSWSQLLNSFSIYYIGAFIVVIALLFWMLPNFLGDLVRFSIGIMQEYKWLSIGAIIFLAFFMAWVVYLRYKLSKSMMENHLILEKHRLDQQLLLHRQLEPPMAEMDGNRHDG